MWRNALLAIAIIGAIGIVAAVGSTWLALLVLHVLTQMIR